MTTPALLAFVLAPAAALAAPVDARLPSVAPNAAPVTGWQAQASLLGGLDAVYDTDTLVAGGPAGLFAHQLSVARKGRDAGWQLTWGGFAELTSDYVSFGEAVDATMALAVPGGPGAGLTIESGGLPGWLNVTAAARSRGRAGSVDYDLRLGGTAHAEDAGSGAGPTALARASVPAGRRFTLHLRADAQLWPTPLAPPWSLRTSLGAAFSPVGRLVVDTALGLRATGSDQDSLDWAGLDPPGDAVGWAALRGTLMPGRWWGVSVDLGAAHSLAGLSPDRVWALGGLTLREAHVGAARDRTAPEPTRFALDAPDAHDVAVIGSFNGWNPVPLQRGGDGVWRTEIWLPPGRWEYAWLVDGVAKPPREAPKHVDDGFGSVNGVVEVPPR